VSDLNEAIEVLTKLRDDYEQRIKALDEAITMLQSNETERDEDSINTVVKNPPFDFSSIPDWNGNKKGGIRNDD
jgi:hypothetical protein